MNDQQGWVIKDTEYRANALAKRAPLAAELLAAGVIRIEMDYSGEGDDGCFGDARCYKGQDDPIDVSYALKNKCLDVGYAALEITHDGWEINEGSYGNLIWDTAANKIRIEHSERIISTEDSIDYV